MDSKIEIVRTKPVEEPEVRLAWPQLSSGEKFVFSVWPSIACERAVHDGSPCYIERRDGGVLVRSDHDCATVRRVDPAPEPEEKLTWPELKPQEMFRFVGEEALYMRVRHGTTDAAGILGMRTAGVLWDCDKDKPIRRVHGVKLYVPQEKP